MNANETLFTITDTKESLPETNLTKKSLLTEFTKEAKLEDEINDVLRITLVLYHIPYCTSKPNAVLACPN